MKIENIQDITPHNTAIYEAGKKLLIETVETTREFCKHMITVTTGGIPVYLGLLEFILPDEYELSIPQINLTILPAVLLFLSCILFVFGYLPRITHFSLDIIQEIEEERKAIIKRRYLFIILGMIAFSSGIVLAIYLCSVFLNITT